jgi:hypothetical protein
LGGPFFESTSQHEICSNSSTAPKARMIAKRLGVEKSIIIAVLMNPKSTKNGKAGS